MKDDRTPYLDLPLPNGENTLDEDLPRLRAAFGALDEDAVRQDAAILASRTPAATQAEVDAGVVSGKYVSPETLAGTTFDAAKITSGVIDISHIPSAALDDLLDVQNDAARFALTSADVHLGSSVRVLEDDAGTPLDPPRLYIVEDMASLDSEAGYREYAAVVRWADIQEKPDVVVREDLEEHNEDATAHDALVQRITVGSLSPIIGVCQVETGGGAGLWFNVDADGQPISPTKSYFDYHPVYSALKRVLVDGQIMVENKPFYIKTVSPATGPFAGKPCRIISPEQMDGFRPHPAFLKNGQLQNAVYIGAYQGTNEGGSPVKVGSRPGKAPIVSLNFPTMKQYCENRNTGGVEGFMLWDIYQLSALQLLMLIEFANPDMQAMVGMGHVSGSAAVTTDYGNQPVWRGYSGLWGNVWQMVDGIRADANKRLEIYKNDGSRTYLSTDLALPVYGSGWTGWIVEMFDNEGSGYNLKDVFVPKTVNGTQTNGTFADNIYGAVANGVYYHGGTWSCGSDAGLFCLHLDYPASHSSTGIGCRLAKV